MSSSELADGSFIGGQATTLASGETSSVVGLAESLYLLVYQEISAAPYL